MRSDNQPGSGPGTGTGGPDFGGSGGGKRPWFGPKRFGWGYRPQTWQGWLVTALMVAVIGTAGTAWKGRPWFPVVVIAVVAVPFVIIAAQRPRR